MIRLLLPPYRPFFPLGLAFAVWGTGLWVLFPTGAVAYPGSLHAALMIGGFLLPVATGFLMTAVPRFTDTDPASAGELLLAALPPAAIAVAAAGGVGEGSRLLAIHAAIGVAFAFLLVFALPRLATRRSEPPPSFFFLAPSILAGLLGAALLVAGHPGVVTAGGLVLGRLLLLHGTMVGLVVGVGIRMVPGLLGRAGEVPAPRRGELPLLALAFFGAFFVEALLATVPGRLLAAVAVTWVALRFFRIGKGPARPGPQPLGLWTSAWLLVLGLWGQAVFPGRAIDLLHLSFVGGLGLTTLLVATRVTLSHGGHDLGPETRSPVLWACVALLLAAAGVRAFAGLVPEWTWPAFAVAAGLWIAGLFLWFLAFAGRLIRAGGPG